MVGLKRTMRKPGTLFRYRSLSGDGFRHTQDIFLRHRLYLPVHFQLNDPTEGVYRHKKGLERRGDSYYAPDSPLLHHDKEVRVLSFSEDHRNALMWSHYADYHQGICIGFKRAIMEQLAPLQQVHYRTRVPTLPEELPEEDKLSAGFLSKSVDWGYEREWRIITFDRREYLDLPRGAISVVVFGVRTPQDDRDWVLEWLRLSECKAAVKEVEFSGHAARMHVSSFNKGDE
jgi:hypothetical protein